MILGVERKSVSILGLSILSILILGGAGSAFEDAFAATTTISDQTTCESAPVSGTWSSPDTCTFSGSVHILPNDTWVVDSGIIFTIDSGADISIDEDGALENNGTLVNSGTIIHIFGNPSSASFTNTGTLDNSAGKIALKGVIGGSLDLGSASFDGQPFEYGVNEYYIIDGTGNHLDILNSGGALVIPDQYTLYNEHAANWIASSQGSVTIESGGTLENTGWFALKGVMINDGHIQNNSIFSHRGQNGADYSGTGTFSGTTIRLSYTADTTEDITLGVGDLSYPNNITTFHVAGINSKINIGSGTTFTIPSGYTIEVNSNPEISVKGTLVNDGTILTEGDIIIEGTVSNTGSIDLSSPSTVDIFGTLDNDLGGSITNNSEITIQCGGMYFGPTPVTPIDIIDGCAPPIAQDDLVGTDEDTVLNGDVLADNGNGIDDDPNGDSLTVIEVNGSVSNVDTQIGVGGSLLTVNSDGTFEFDPNGDWDFLAQGDQASMGSGFDYKISDGNGGESTATVTIAIDGVNDDPVAVDDGDGSLAAIFVDEDSEINPSFYKDNDSDPDNLETALLDIVSVTQPGTGEVSLEIDDSIVFNAAGFFDYLGVGDTANTTFGYTIEDPNGAQSSATVYVEVTGVNDAPVFVVEPPVPITDHEAGTPFTDMPDTFDAEGDTVTVEILTNLIDPNWTETPGSYVVEYSLYDNNGGQTFSNRDVTVIDTTPPVFTTVPADDRTEGDDDLVTQVSLSAFTVTATDAPRTTAPLINCTDEFLIPTNTIVDAPGTAIGVVFSSTPGINTVTCVASDGTNTNLAPYTFDLIVSEIFFDPVANLEPKWDEEITVEGDVYGFLPGEKVKVTYGADTVDNPVEVLIAGADPDAGWHWISTHSFSSGTSDSTQTISVELFENPTHATTASQDVDVKKHDVAFSNNDQTNVLWGDPVEKSGTLDDLFAGTGVALTAEIIVSGDGIDTNADGVVDVLDLPVNVNTDSNGDFIVSGNSPKLAATGLTINTSFDGNQFYNAAPAIADDLYDNAKHPTALLEVNTPPMPNGDPWGATATKSGILVDTHLGDLPLADMDVYLDGDGLGTLEFSLTTDEFGEFSTTGSTISKTAANVVVEVSTDETDLYLAAPTITDTYSTIPHLTTLTLGNVENVLAQTPATIFGTLTDDVTGDVVADKTITYSVLQGESFAIPDSTTSGDITIDPVDTLTVSGGELGIKDGTVVRHPSNPEIVNLTIEPMGALQLHLEVFTMVDDMEYSYPITATNSGVDPVEFPLIYGTGVSHWKITDITGGAPDASVPISKIEERNADNKTTKTITFSDTGSPFSFLQFPGTFRTIADTPVMEAEDFIVTATFAGDDDYGDSSGDSNEFDTLFNTLIICPTCGASGNGVASSQLEDTGVGIVAYSCDIPSSSDDGICDEWKTAGIPFDVGAVEKFYPLTGTTIGERDLLFEIDAMPDHVPSAIALTAVEDAFDAIGGGNDVNLIQFVDDEDVTHEDETAVWSGFNEIKAKWYGTDDEKVTFTTSPITTTVLSQKLLLPFEDDLTDSTGISSPTISSGTATFVPGPSGKAISLGGSQYVNVGDTFDLESNKPFSIAAWVNTETTTTEMLVSKMENSAPFRGYGILIDSTGKIRAQILNDNSPALKIDFKGTSIINDGEWYHVALTYDGTSTAEGTKLYVNGVEEAKTAITDTLGGLTIENAEDLLVGSRGGGLLFNGEIDDVRFYDYELLPDQLDSLIMPAIPAAVSAWNFEDTASPNVVDSIGSSDGTVSGSWDHAAGHVIGSSFDFDGSTYITTAESPFDFEYNNPAEGFSISLWLNTGSTATDMLVSKQKGNGNYNGYSLYLSSGKVVGQIVHDNRPTSKIQLSTTANVNDNEWHHIALTYDGSGDLAGTTIYIDGIAQAKASTTDNLSENSILNDEDLTIGARNGKNVYTGLMDDVRVYNFGLTSTQVNDIANPMVDLQSLLEISGIQLTTPNTPLTSGETEAIVKLKFVVDHDTDSNLLGNPGSQANLVGSPFTLNLDNAAISTLGNPLDTSENFLGVTVPLVTVTPQTGTDVGTIQVPLISSKIITNVTPDGDPKVTSTLLNAKAQAVRYALFAHSIGGSSGQSELRGNDLIVALGVGFEENNAGHAGTEGSDDEVSGTYLHEIGHILNLRHAAPDYLQDAKTTTIATADQNCVPIQKSIMSYTGQLPTYLGLDWALRFNEVGRTNSGDTPVTLNENTLDEDAGILIGPGPVGTGPVIVFATPESSITTDVEDAADGNPIDWNGDGSFGDISTPSTLAEFDINNFGIPGCEASPGETMEIFNEPANFDFNFQDDVDGQFDGFNPTGQPEKPWQVHGVEILFGADFAVLPPLEVDGTDFVKAGRNIPIKFLYFDQVTDINAPLSFINDAVIRADLVEPDGTVTMLGYFENPLEDGDHYQFNWDSEKDYSGTEVGVKAVVIIDNPLGGTIERTLQIPIEAMPVPLFIETPGEDVGVTVKVRFR